MTSRAWIRIPFAMTGMTSNRKNSEGIPPDFAIVIPCYNEVNAIEETLGSVEKDLKQSSNHEVIVVNDGSNDGTLELLQKICLFFGIG